MASSAIDGDFTTRLRAKRIARKVLREVARPFQRLQRKLEPAPAAETPTAALAQDWDTQLYQYVKGSVLPQPSGVHDHYVPSRWLGHHGIDLNESAQLARIESWRADRYQELYRRLRNDAQINCGFGETKYLGSTCLHNGWYPTPDAEIYASMIYDFRPDRIVEVGSGFSTLIARRALEFAGLKVPLIVVDPEPRTDVKRIADRVILQRVEDCRLDSLGLTSKSLLFIDSSHITRARGDVPYLYSEVLPQLAAGTLVHIHDIFTPYDYPTCYDHLCWTEQYVLQAMLAHSSRYRTLMSTQYLSRHQTAAMQATFGPQVGADNLFFGGSYWIQVC